MIFSSWNLKRRLLLCANRKRCYPLKRFDHKEFVGPAGELKVFGANMQWGLTLFCHRGYSLDRVDDLRLS